MTELRRAEAEWLRVQALIEPGRDVAVRRMDDFGFLFWMAELATENGYSVRWLDDGKTVVFGVEQ